MRPTPRLIAVPAVMLAAASLLSTAPLAAQWSPDAWLEQPVDSSTFEGWRPFFSYDAGLPFSLETLAVEDDEGIRVEHISFTSTPDEVVHADYYTVPAAGRGRPHLVLVHGGIQSGKESVRTIAEVLVRRGFGVIAIDMPYFGERDTGLLRSFSEADKHEHLYNRESTYLEWLVQLVKDIGRTIDLLQGHYGVDPDRIGYVGFSRGAQAGFVVVGAEPRLAAAGLMYGGHFDRSETGHLAAACPANYIGRIAPRPLWLLSGEFDGDYDRERSVEPLYRHAGQPTEIHWVETGHQLPRQEDLERLADWLSSVLG
jgi:dienelactone hydrolase